MLRALFAGAGLLFAVSAHALSGEEIVRYCERNACGGYFIGAFDALRIAGAVGTDKQRRAVAICPPDPLDDELGVSAAPSRVALFTGE